MSDANHAHIASVAERLGGPSARTLLTSLLEGLTPDDIEWVAARIGGHRLAVAEADRRGDAVSEPKWITPETIRRRGRANGDHGVEPRSRRRRQTAAARRSHAA